MLGRLHVITDVEVQQRFSHLQLAQLADKGGADVVQYRDKNEHRLSTLLRQALLLNAELEEAELVINDHVDIAKAANAYGVHLGPNDMSMQAAREAFSSGIIGATANCLSDAKALCKQPIDYLGVGPVFATSSKKNPAAVLGLEALREIVLAVDKPVIAIGGITYENVRSVLETGVHGIAVLSAVVCANDPQYATRQFRELIEGFNK
jgi:thiamine-phosphate pyrophosphorylase